MKELLVLAALVSAAIAVPVKTDNSETLIIDESFFSEELVLHRAEHDIVDIMVPMNLLNFQDSDKNDSTSSENDENITLFFIEADIDSNGSKTPQGLSVLTKGKAKKLLDNGRDAIAGDDNSKDAFFAATDGIYYYDADNNEAKKYGSINESLKSIVKINGSDTFYVLKKNNKVLKVTEKGTKKELVTNIENAQQIVLTPNNLLFYVDNKNDVYIFKDNIATKVSLPDNLKYTDVKLLRPMRLVFEDTIFAIFDNTPYGIYSNGSVERIDIDIKTKPTAYGMDATLIQYFGYDKKIYEYNILVIVLTNLLNGLTNFINALKFDLQALAGNRILH